MTRRRVLVVYAGGQYRWREFPTEEAAQHHALEVCHAFPDVQHGSCLLQTGRPADA